VLQQFQIEAVIHFAANAYVGESITDPRKYFRNNVANALQLLEAMLDTKVGSIVFSSTCATYGIPKVTPIDEDTPQHPVNPYGESKLMVERMLYWFGQAYGLRWVALRYFNAAGADPSGEIGEVHVPETHLIPLAIEAAILPGHSIRVFGDDYPTADGTAIRDYIHVMDLARAHLHAIRHLAAGGRSQALNVGTGKGYSVFEIIRAVENVAGRRVASEITARRQGDPAILVADPRAARSVLGWEAEHTDIGETIEAAWRWRLSRI
jgi:UDP-glucose-4-epimerase GalE